MEFLRRRLGLIVRIGISGLLIGYLAVKEVNWPKLLQIVRTEDPGWLVASFCCFAPVVLIVAWRWRMLLGVHGVHLRFWRVFELNMIGQFFSAFLLGTTGGDVIKIFYAARAVPQRRAAVAFTVVVDRVIGMVAMLILGVGLSFTKLPLLLSTPGTKVATGSFYFFAAGGVGGCVLATLGPALLSHPSVRALVKRLPFVHRGTSLFTAYERTARAVRVNLLALVGSIPSHLSIISMGYCILRALHFHPGLVAFAAIILIVNMLIALPVSISGFGVREGLFIMFLALLHIDKDHAFAFSLTFFAVNLLWSLVAGPFYFLYRHETHEPAPDVPPDATILSNT
jgi:uncharacterized membrane protein YbhN (UPF0104 family)